MKRTIEDAILLSQHHLHIKNEEIKIGIVGNRENWTEKEVFEKLEELNIDSRFTLITGGAEGVDTFVMKYAKIHGCKLIVYYPDYKKYNDNATKKRNKKIAEEIYFLIAFNKKEYSGTTQTINFTLGLNKLILTYGGE
jgi:predicted Rossmann fold nucleotide-binding protein DprA/Smf involved in DNA uptake